MIRIISIIILSGIITPILSKLIARLYSHETSDLSFPDKIKQRATLRIPLLFVGCAAIFTQYDTNVPLAGLFNLCFYFPLLIVVVTDWEQYIIFDSVLLFFAITGLSQSLLASNYISSPAGLTSVMPTGPIDALLTGVCVGGLMLLLAIILKGSIFGGDIKLIAASGIWLGSKYIPAAVVLGFILGGLAAIVLLITTNKKRTDFFAYGPYFAIATVIIRLTGITL